MPLNAIGHTKRPGKLPNKPSELIMLALGDLARAEQDERYVVNMGWWHAPDTGIGRCIVCLAGSVMAFSLQAMPEYKAWPEHFTEGKKLTALNWLRSGYIKMGLELLGHERPRGMHVARQITEYYEDAKQFKTDMQQLADDLAEAGL